MKSKKMVDRGRLGWPEEYRLAHNLLKMDGTMRIDPGFSGFCR
jgi:hypothetical protein